MISHRNFSLLFLLQNYLLFYFWLEYIILSLKHLSKHPLPFSSSSSSTYMSIILEPFVPDPSVILLVSTSVFLTISTMICFVCYSVVSMITLVLWSGEENNILSISSCNWLMISNFIPNFYGSKYLSYGTSDRPGRLGLVTCRNIYCHALMGRPAARLETMALVNQTYVLLENEGNRQ